MLAYATEMGTITKRELEHFEFLVIINDSTYLIKVDWVHDGSNCALFYSEKRTSPTSNTTPLNKIRKEENLNITPIHKPKKEEAPSQNIIEKLNTAYDKHKQKCRW